MFVPYTVGLLKLDYNVGNGRRKMIVSNNIVILKTVVCKQFVGLTSWGNDENVIKLKLLCCFVSYQLSIIWYRTVWYCIISYRIALHCVVLCCVSEAQGKVIHLTGSNFNFNVYNVQRVICNMSF